MLEYNESNRHSFLLTLFAEGEELVFLSLPKVAEGFFRFSEKPQHHFLSICAKDGQWVVSCLKPAFFQEVPLANSYELPLCDGQLLKISIEDRSYRVLVQKVVPFRSIFHNYTLCADRTITIGSGMDCDICYQGPFLARNHATIIRSGGKWQIRCLDRLYGMYINNVRRQEAELQLGDVVYLMGLKLIAGQNFLSINSGLGSVRVSDAVTQDSTISRNSYSHYYNHDESEHTEQYFNRAPRKRREATEKIISIEGPPMSLSSKHAPLLLRMGGSLVMGGAAALTGNFMSLITSVLFPLMNNKYSESERQEYEKLRVSKYTEYLQRKRQEILQAITEEQEYLNQKYPLVNSLIAPGRVHSHLWERRPCDSDFLQLRLGTGTRPLSAKIHYPTESFALEPDALEVQMRQLAQASYSVPNTPIVLSLMDTYICGIQGNRTDVLEYIRQLILQAAVLHSYDEVKMVFLLSPQELALLDDIRYLPHTWDDQRATRFIATNEGEAYSIGEYLQDQLQLDDNNKDVQQILKKRPFYLIFALDKKLFEGHEVLKQLLQADTNPGAAIITAHDALPKESQKIIKLETALKNTCTTMGVDGGADELFAMDPVSRRQLNSTMHTLANTSLKKIDEVQALPKMVTFMDMFQTGRVEQLNPLKRWRENNPAKSLAAPVGIAEDGSLFMLDLHEKRQGPHGLVAGMTGSGKSEFLITYILSMALNYHPDEVAFVLIDYKGGGLADAFENPRTGMRLPHLVGTITNLDGASIQRSLMSIESELIRRQKIFSQTSKAFNEGSMNIYKYQKLYRAGKVTEPMPHLFVISDEFAELKQQQPEFMEKLVSAARIGRSLGVHLILATQKPSGVVNDQIRSNTKFRVCMRVQDRADSMDMLKRPEAAELTDTGRFYLQVGYNEFFALGQSAWCGADYQPQDTLPVRRDDALEFLDITGQVTAQNKPKVKKVDSGMSQIVAAVKYLSDLARQQGIQPRPLWQPELPKLLDLDPLQKHVAADTEVCLGIVDDPTNQQQFPLTMDFMTCGNLLITGTGGKTAIAQNILYTLANRLPPEAFNFYVLDYSSRMMKLLKPLPHCGSILQEEDVNALDEFFKLINGLITERKRLFSRLEVDNFAEACTHTKLPLILVVIDNITGLGASKVGENHLYNMAAYLKNCDTYGIKYVATASLLKEVPSRFRQEFTERICLNLRDRFEYGEALGCTVEYLPPQIPGRGMVKASDAPLEFHSAIMQPDATNNDRTNWLKDQVIRIAERYGTTHEALRLPEYSETATFEDFARQFKRGRIPLGYAKHTGKPVALPLKQFSALSVFFGNPAGSHPITENLLLAAQRAQMQIWFVKRSEDSVLDTPGYSLPANTRVFTPELESLDELRAALTDLRTQRKELLQRYCEEKGLYGSLAEHYKDTFPYLQENTQPILLLFESYAQFCNSVDMLRALIFDKCLQEAQLYNVYTIGCFTPNDHEGIKNKVLYNGFNPNQNILLFGGQFHMQTLCELPAANDLEKMLQYNAGIMRYQDGFYPILMPCGQILAQQVDEDEQSIF